MLTEKRQEEIVRLVYERESITVAELKEILHSSESTIRRDIIALDQEGKKISRLQKNRRSRVMPRR